METEDEELVKGDDGDDTGVDAGKDMAMHDDKFVTNLYDSLQLASVFLNTMSEVNISTLNSDYICLQEKTSF